MMPRPEPSAGTTQPWVSVIIPTRNSSRTLEACLRSIRMQCHPGVETIVVDNASTDGTLAIAKQFADVVLTCGPERSAQRNFGARIAHGDYLLFVDSDMILPEQVVAACLATIRATEAPAVIIPERSVGVGFWARCRALERSCYVGDDLVEAARFYPRKEFEAANGFDETLTGPEDWDLSRRVTSGIRLPRTDVQILHDEGRIRLAAWLAKKRYYAPGVLRYLRMHGPTTLRQANVVMRPAYLRYWRRLIKHPGLAAGVITLKGLEVLAALSGMFAAQRDSSKLRRGRP